jgi:hypothetical protein
LILRRLIIVEEKSVMPNKFLVFQCKRCQKFLYAPLPQKTRFCPYCQKVTPIPRDQVQLCNSAAGAGELVRQFNGGRAVAEFVTAADSSRDEIERLLKDLPNEDRIQSQPTGVESTGTQKELLGLLAKYAKSIPISMDDFREKCLQNDLSWEWVKEQLPLLAQQSVGKAPGLTESTHENLRKPIPTHPGKSQLRRQIQQILENASSPLSLENIFEQVSLGASLIELETVLRELLQQGIIYEPRSNVFVKI